MFPVNPCTLTAVLCGVLTLEDPRGETESTKGEDFRVENKVFLGSRRKPVSQSTTIFHDGLVYDYMQEPAEVIVLDSASGRFVLLDTIRRVRAELTTDDVAAFVRELRRLTTAQKDPLKKFLAAPKFDEKYDESTGELTLSSQWVTYRLLLETVHSESIAAQYREFADWYVQLNTVLNPGSRPPFARLLVNTALEEHRATPREVHLTMNLRRLLPPKRVSVRSQHKLIREVAEADLDRVTQTRQFMDIFKRVSFEQYRKPENR